MPHGAYKLHLGRTVRVVRGKAKLRLEVATLSRENMSGEITKNAQKNDVGQKVRLFVSIVEQHNNTLRQPEETTYLVEGGLGALEGHIPQEQVIVVFEPDACTEVVVVLHVWSQERQGQLG